MQRLQPETRAVHAAVDGLLASKATGTELRGLHEEAAKLPWFNLTSYRWAATLWRQMKNDTALRVMLRPFLLAHVAATLAAVVMESERQRVEVEGQLFQVPMGPRSRGLSRSLGFVYPRYAEDLALSGDDATMVDLLIHRAEACGRHGEHGAGAAAHRATQAAGRGAPPEHEGRDR